MALTLKDLEARADALQAALDAKQEALTKAIASFQQTIADLKATIETGGSQAELQVIADKQDATLADLQSTVINEPA